MSLSDVLPAGLLVRVAVRAYVGESGKGPAYGATVTVPAVWDDTRRLVRTQDTARLEAAGTVYLDLDVTCPPESLVTVPDGRTFKAVLVSRLDGGGLPVDHQEVTVV